MNEERYKKNENNFTTDSICALSLSLSIHNPQSLKYLFVRRFGYHICLSNISEELIIYMTETSNKLEVNSENFNSRLASPIFDSGKSLRSILYKKGRGRRCSLFRPWEERFCILDRSILLLRYYDISRLIF